MSSCGKCIFKPFCRSAWAVCSSFKNTDNFVEVVRCKDCENWDKAKVNKKGSLVCPVSNMEIYASDFCSKGKRKAQQ